jgi:hypothetical protein
VYSDLRLSELLNYSEPPEKLSVCIQDGQYVELFFNSSRLILGGFGTTEATLVTRLHTVKQIHIVVPDATTR